MVCDRVEEERILFLANALLASFETVRRFLRDVASLEVNAMTRDVVTGNDILIFIHPFHGIESCPLHDTLIARSCLDSLRATRFPLFLPVNILRISFRGKIEMICSGSVIVSIG
jgi:hypothetical protein